MPAASLSQQGPQAQGLPSPPPNGNLFDGKIPLVVFEEGDSLLLLLQLAADAVEFDYDVGKVEMENLLFLESVEYQDLSPKQALLDFEQLTGIRVVVDSAQRKIRLR